MKNKIKTWALLLPVLFLAFGPALYVWGDGRSQIVKPVAPFKGSADGVEVVTNITNYRSGLSGDTITAIGSATSTEGTGTIAEVNTITCSGYLVVSLPVLFSDGSGATVVVTAVRYFDDVSGTSTFQGLENQTITGNQVYTVSGLFPGTREPEFPTYGCNTMKVLVAAPSAGTVTLGPVKVH